MQLQDLEEIGFVHNSKYLNTYLRRHPEIFPGLVRFAMGAPPYEKEVFELFGTGHLSYFYKLENKADFERHLERMFRVRKPSAGKRLTASFTMRLHKEGFHWSGCDDRRSSQPTANEETEKSMCLYCGEKTHLATHCPLRKERIASAHA